MAKGSTSARGYGHHHQKLRDRWRPKVDAGLVDCARPTCGKPILPGQEWQLGHDDNDRSRYHGPEHRYCNESAGGRKGAAITNARHQTTNRTSRDW
ncbi:hypothetical protein ABT336_00305 [Micromonospora sp. NPDC000207]|uniref:hypothetical protein n=1 Tax=Micromonospora sp. NPDC000207 TaxID=3154246 RepID=UPI003317F48E